MASEIVLIVTEQRNRQRILLPAAKAPCSFGRGPRCDYVLRRNNVGDRQFTLEYADGAWQLRDDAGGFATWYNNRYLRPGERCPLQEGDVIGLNTDGNDATQEITFRVQEIRAAADAGGLRAEAEDDPVLREIDLRRKRRVLIGRGEDCDVQLASDRVSRHHCEITFQDGHAELKDLGSTNGTYLNGQRVRTALLPEGALINVPTQVFAYAGGGAALPRTPAGHQRAAHQPAQDGQGPQHRQPAGHCGRRFDGDRTQQLCGAGGRVGGRQVQPAHLHHRHGPLHRRQRLF